MIIKPERIIKRIIKAAGERQAVLIIGDWQEELIKGIKENQNTITRILDLTANSSGKLIDNSFTRVIADYNMVQDFFKEVRRFLLPTGILIITANTEVWLPEKIFNFISRKKTITDESIKKIKPKLLQDEIHNNDFLIDGYYCYPEGHLIMIALIQNKEVSTLFSSEKQETTKT